MQFLLSIFGVLLLPSLTGRLEHLYHPFVIPNDGRERFVHEGHVFFACFNTALAVSVATWFSQPMLPSLAMAVGTFGTWCLYRAYDRRVRTKLWDNRDMCLLAVALLVGIVAAVLTAVFLSIPLVAALWPVLVLVVAWMAFFPL